MTQYRQWIKDALDAGLSVPVFGRAVPSGEPTPEGAKVFVTFKAPTHVAMGKGIVSARKDLHIVAFFVRVAGPDEDEVLDTMDNVLDILVGASPPDSGEITSVFGETWGVLDSRSRPQEYNEAASFLFYTNLGGM